MIDSKEAIRILKEEGCSTEVLNHVRAVRDVSMEIAENIEKSGVDVDKNLVEVGALLHDIGRSKTHDIKHGVEGSKILKERGLKKIVPIAENHLGAGIAKEEAEKLDLPEKDFLPSSLEEKIVTYGDNLIVEDKRQTYEEALEEMREELGQNHEGVSRFKNMHDELEKLGAFN